MSALHALEHSRKVYREILGRRGCCSTIGGLHIVRRTKAAQLPTI